MCLYGFGHLNSNNIVDIDLSLLCFTVCTTWSFVKVKKKRPIASGIGSDVHNFAYLKQ